MNFQLFNNSPERYVCSPLSPIQSLSFASCKTNNSWFRENISWFLSLRARLSCEAYYSRKLFPSYDYSCKYLYISTTVNDLPLVSRKIWWWKPRKTLSAPQAVHVHSINAMLMSPSSVVKHFRLDTHFLFIALDSLRCSFAKFDFMFNL